MTGPRRNGSARSKGTVRGADRNAAVRATAVTDDLAPDTVARDAALRLPASPGTYAVAFLCSAEGEVEIGRRGKLAVAPGRYVYVGSAFGPGGLAARIGRHCRVDKPLRWHVDYLRSIMSPESVVFSTARQRLEHVWASRLAGSKTLSVVPAFGCSDCGCASHLFFAPGANIDSQDLGRLLGGRGSSLRAEALC